MPQRTPGRERRDNAQKEIRYLQIVYLIRFTIENIRQTPTTQQQKANNPVGKPGKEFE